MPLGGQTPRHCHAAPACAGLGLMRLWPCWAGFNEAVPGLGLWGGIPGEHLKSGMSCCPSPGSECRWAQPEHRAPSWGANIPWQC